MEKITASMHVREILDMDDNIHQIFLKHGMYCTGCPGAESESLEEAAEGHMTDLNKLLDELNRYIEMK